MWEMFVTFMGHSSQLHIAGRLFTHPHTFTKPSACWSHINLSKARCDPLINHVTRCSKVVEKRAMPTSDQESRISAKDSAGETMQALPFFSMNPVSIIFT